MDQDIRKAQQQETMGLYLFRKHRCPRKGGANRWPRYSISIWWEEEGDNWSHEQGKEGEALGG